LLEVIAELFDPESNWASVEKEVASLLEEIPREDRQDQRPASEVRSTTCRLLWAALVISGATIVIRLVSPYLAWFAAVVGR
jgi:hypothetical protein